MRIRSIRPEFWSSEDVAAMDWHTRLVYIGLWNYVDDNGVGRDLERLIVTELFPLDDDLTEASLRTHGALKHLETHGQITRYRVHGKPYLHITAWDAHQKINRPSAGRYPQPDAENATPSPRLTEPSVSLPANAPLGEGEKGRRGEGEKREARRRATQLPADWEPNEGHAAIATERGLDLNDVAANFRDHHTAKASTYVDWNAAFRTWLRRERPAQGGRPSGRPVQPGSAEYWDREMAQAAALDAALETHPFKQIGHAS